MNLSIKQVNALLKQLGGSVVVVEDEKADTDANIEDIASEIEGVIVKQVRPAIEQELKESIGSVKAAEAGRMERSAVAKAFGLTPKELDGLSLTEMLAKGKETLSQGKQDGEAEFNARIAEMQADYDQRLEEANNQITEARKKYVDRDINSKLSSFIEKVPRKGGKLDAQTSAFRHHLNQKFGDIEYDENTGEMSFVKDGKKVFNDRNKPFDFTELAKSWADDTGISVTDMRHETPPNTPPPSLGNPMGNGLPADPVALMEGYMAQQQG